MSSKKNIHQISAYYQDKQVVASYDDRRFQGIGGRYINTQETGLIQASFKKNFKTKPVLDLGAGRGRLSLPLKNSGLDVYCLDASPEMISYLSKHFPKKNLFLQSIFDQINSKVKFAGITGLRFFDHFNLVDQTKILNQVQTSLDKNGVIVFAPLNSHSLEAGLSQFFPYGRYNYFYSDEQYRTMFDKLGFSVKAFRSGFALPRGLFLKLGNNQGLINLAQFLDSTLLRIFPRCGALYVYTLTKKS